MIAALDIEAIFAQVGLLPILRARPRIGKGTLRAAADATRATRRALLRFLASDKWEPAADLVALDYDEVMAWVSAGKLQPAQVNALFAAVPDKELAQDLAEIADRILPWANSILPREPPDPLTGVVDEPPPNLLYDFRRLWGVACDPSSIMADLADGSLFDDQVAALAQLFPATFGDTQAAVMDTVSTMVARRGKKWKPDPTKGALVDTLRQRQSTDPDLAGAVQGIYAAQLQAEEQAAPPPPKRAAAGGAVNDSQSTPGEKSAAG